MTDVLDPASIIEAAQQAAAAGDYPEAERLLRRAATIQEGRLGPLHPDLAITLNNLALMCERTNKFDEAERGFRRAHTIAIASLSPGHPFIATSLKNLVEFCAAHEIPLWKPPSTRSDDGTALPDAAAEAQLDPVAPAYTRRSWLPRRIALATLGAAAVVAAVFALQGWRTSSLSNGLPNTENGPTTNDAPAPSATAPALREPQPTPTLDRPRDSTPASVDRSKPGETSAALSSVTVLNAQLCSALEKSGSPDWHCASANGDLEPGTYIFYTRLLTNVDTTVEHRWYRGDRLHQVRRLRVSSSPGRGYRTFSSNTISPERAGDWKVELRAADGTLLREAHFIVR